MANTMLESQTACHGKNLILATLATHSAAHYGRIAVKNTTPKPQNVRRYSAIKILVNSSAQNSDMPSPKEDAPLPVDANPSDSNFA